MMPLLLLGTALAGDVSGYAIPNAAFDTDDGLGGGARAELAWLDPDLQPYGSAWMVHAYASFRGFHHHRVRYDRLGLGPDGHLRATFFLAWRQWTNDGYWGIGPGTTRERAYVGDFDADDPVRKRYRYTLVQPYSHWTLRADLGGPWQAYTALDVKWSEVQTYAGSLLEEQEPHGMDGGLTVQVFAGGLYDSRKPEIDPRAGLLLEAGGRWAPPHPGSAGSFGGPLLNLRGYHRLGDRLVLAGRLMGEWLWGDVPFYEMVHWGGLFPTTGMGGSETIRGVSFGRIRGPGKAVANLELRTDVVAHQLRGKPMRWQLVPYVDAGTVWGAPPATPDAPPVMPAAGLGIRPIYDETFIARIDAGVGLDPVLEPDGGVSLEPTPGFYLVFEHLF